MAEGEAKVASLQAELGSELLSQLSREEQEEVARISARMQQLKEELKGVQTSRLQGQVAVQELESLLSGNLQQRQQVKTSSGICKLQGGGGGRPCRMPL